MLDKIIKISLRKRLLVLIATILLFIIGVVISLNLPVDIFPDLTAPTVTIMTEAHGMAAEEVEALVTFPIETSVNGATNVRRVRSVSASGFSTVWVEFDWGTDIFIARQIVNEKLQSLSGLLPKGVGTPTLTPISSIMGEIMIVSLSINDKENSNNLSMMDLRTIADNNIRRRLLSVSGVAQVLNIGGDVKEYKILVSPEKLASFQISLSEVLQAVEKCNLNSSGGMFEESGSEYLIRGIGKVQTIADIENSVIKVRNNVPIFIKDVANVKIGAKIKIGDGSVDAKPSVVILIQKQPQINTLELTKRLESTFVDIEKNLPKGIIFNKEIFRSSDFITVSIDNVISALRDGAILVVFVLFIFLLNFRITFISVTAIPLSLIITIIIFKLFDIGINTMTLGGMAIAIGAIVDDAIIDVENVYRRLKEKYNNNENFKKIALDIIYEASKEIRAPMVNATLIIIIVFLPLFFLSGIEGRLLRPMGYAYILSILASLLVALTVTPVLSYYLLCNKKLAKVKADTKFVELLKKYYLNILQFSLSNPKKIIIASIILLMSALAIVPFLGRSFLPEFNEGSYTMSLVTLPGTSLSESNKIGKLAEEIILSHKEVLSVARRTGRAELDEHGQGVYGAEIDVRFKLENKSKEEFTEEIRNSLSKIPGTVVTIGQPISHRIDHMLSGTRANIAVKLFGSDLNTLRNYAKQIENQIKSVEGAVDVAIEQEMEVPQIKINFKRESIAQYGLTIEDIAEAIDIGFNGEIATEIKEGQNNISAIVIFNDDNRGNINSILNSKISTPSGIQIPLNQLAEINISTGPNKISRENVQRKVVIQSNVSGRDLKSVVDEIKEKVKNNVNLPEDYFIDYGGQFESEQEASKIIVLFSFISLCLILMILYFQYGNIKPALFILINLPLALIGGVFAVFFTGGVISVASTVGFITLFGIATRNGILLISHFRNLADKGLEIKEVVIKGSLERLNPILMTALTAGLALVPIALGSDEPGKEIESPMAVVILGGLITSTFLNMIVLPLIYYKFSSKKTTGS